MKRYWKIISICLVTLMVIGTFYIQSSFATNEHVEIEFKKVSGNEAEVKKIILQGDYYANRIHQPLQITSEETIDPYNLSFFQKLSKTGVPHYLEDLAEKHRNFMRSKDLMFHHFFEDENVVAYAAIKVKNNVHPITNPTFDIEVLDKKSEEVTSIQLDVPDAENYSWMQVEDVQATEGELKVITRVSRINSGDELRIYAFDMNGLKLVADYMIASTPAIENGWSDLRIIHDYALIQRNNYLLIKIASSKDDMGHRHGESNEVTNEFIVYDIENNQSKKIVGPSEIFGSIADARILNSTFYVLSQSANGVEVNQFDIENDKWETKLAFDLGDTKDEEYPFMKLMDGKLYRIYATTNGHTLFIGDIETGESLYEGQLKAKNNGADLKDYSLYFHDLEYVQ